MRRKNTPLFSLLLSSLLEAYQRQQEEVSNDPKFFFPFSLSTVTSNPFIRVKYSEQRYRTSTVARSLQPIWNESFIFPYQPTLKALLSIYDCVSFGRDTVIGSDGFYFFSHFISLFLSLSLSVSQVMLRSRPPPHISHVQNGSQSKQGIVLS
jgi:hypothetical protein